MATQAGVRAMKSQGHAAIRAFARLSAVPAKERRGKATAIQKEDRLFFFRQAFPNRASQLLGQYRGRFFFPSLLAQIDNPD
jgi:hypothetical protein